MTQAKFPVMLDEERAKYVTREIKYEQEIESLRQQLAECQTKHDVACSTITLLQEKCDVRGRALSLQCQETKELRQQLAECHKLLDESKPF